MISMFRRRARAGRRRKWISPHRLIETLADKWKPEEFRDTYTEALRKAIEAKVEGKELDLPREERRRPVGNLMKALEQSLARKEPAKTADRTEKGPQRRRAGKRAA
jgi:DNA end-binding protein Ku